MAERHANPSTPGRDISNLLAIMARLRDRQHGCPWDLAQDFDSIAPYTIEEAYEVADAITRGDMQDLCAELGDLLLQTVYHAQMADEQDLFDFGDIVYAISDKMIRRHPHVFSAQASKETKPDAQKRATGWEEIKAQERLSRNEPNAKLSILADIPANLPGLTRAYKLQNRAANVGFDWKHPAQVILKIEEELSEVKSEMISDGPDDYTHNITNIESEIGDLLFVVVNLARKLDIDPDRAIRRTNEKFVQRFTYIESQLAGAETSLEAASLEEMEKLWQEAKINEHDTISTR